MARTGPEHSPGCGIEGKCSVLMWDGGGPSGFCDRPAYGEQYDFDSGYADPSWLRPGQWSGGGGRQRPYAPAFCCDGHGGPSANAVRFVRDGDMWCAFLPGFVNLQESVAGFGKTQRDAERDMRARLESNAS